MSFLQAAIDERNRRQNLALKERELDFSDRDAQLKQRKLESEQAQQQLEEQGRYVGAYMSAKTLKQKKALYPLLVQSGQRKGYFEDLDSKWSPKIHQTIAFMHKTLPQNIERAKFDFDKQYKMEKLDLEKEQFELKRQESLMPNPDEFIYKNTADGIVKINKDTGDFETLKDKQGQPLRPQDTRTVVNVGNKKISERVTEDILKKQFDNATASESLTPLLNEATQIVSEIQTSPFARVVGKAQTIANIVSAGNYQPEAYTKYQRLETISKELGAKTLSLFGGNDSGRELLVAIATNPSMDKTNLANMTIINRKQIASDLLREKPNFTINFIQENGDILAKNKEGKTFAKAWQEYQTKEWKSRLKKSGEDVKNIKTINSKEEKQQIDNQVKAIRNKKTGIGSATPQNKGEIKFLGFE